MEERVLKRLWVAVTVAVAVGVTVCAASKEHHSSHTNNWAVLVCASRYWFNYRHVANTLSIYRSVKRLGIPDSNIILMLADDMACNARNPRPATVFNNANQHINVYGDDIEVDYRGYEVTVENFLRVLTGRLDSSVPRSKRLLTDDRSNILVYMTGHGGEGFLKFQDAEEISNLELGDAFEQMWQKRRYNELMYIIDTCQAGSMFTSFYSPNIVATGSSSVNEDSLSHHMDNGIGVHIIDRWTYYALEFLEKVTPSSQSTLADFFASFDPVKVKSTPQVRTDLFGRRLDHVLVTDFFGSVRNVELLNQTLTVVGAGEGEGQGRGGSSSPDTGEGLPHAHYLTPQDALAIPLADKSAKVSSDIELFVVGFFMTVITVATTVGIYHVIVADR